MDYPFSPAERKQHFWGIHQGDKSTIRSQVLAQRKQMNPRAASYKSSGINQQLDDFCAIQSARTIACYHPIQNEVDLTSFIQACQSNNKRLVFPKVHSKEMQFYAVDQLEEQLQPGSFGILEPDTAICDLVAPGEIDVFIVPGVAFDLLGFRVGYGGGYYDRYLLNKRKDAITIGVGYDFQLLHAIESDDFDIPLDYVITNSANGNQVLASQTSRITTNSPDETQVLAKTLLDRGLSQQNVIALHGGLGTGKTEFVKGLANACEIDQHVASPSYVFIHEYTGKQSFRHIDSYRIDTLRASDEEFWSEALVKENGFVVIEWAEKIGNLLPYDTVHLYGISSEQEENTREWCLFTAYQHQHELHRETC